MAKKAKRKPNGHAARATVDQVRDRERQDLQRAIRHQKKIRSLNRQLSSAIRSADSSLIQLHDLLVDHPVVVRAIDQDGGGAGVTSRPT
jgi:hypothetical protein